MTIAVKAQSRTGTPRKRSRKELSEQGPVRHRADDFNRETWLTFLDEYLWEDPEEKDGRRFNGQLLEQSDHRALFRWRHEGTSPSIWTADRFLCRYGLYLNEFFLFAETADLPIWARGVPPEWHERHDVAIDLQSSDPEWALEAAAELAHSEASEAVTDADCLVLVT